MLVCLMYICQIYRKKNYQKQLEKHNMQPVEFGVSRLFFFLMTTFSCSFFWAQWDNVSYIPKILTLLVLCISEGCIEIKINLNFYF